MKLYTLQTKQTLPMDISTAWRFFSNPENLRTITPEYLSFEILTKNLPEKIYPGLIIEYTVKPLLGLPVGWVTEITQVENERFFIDEQRFGPYKFWHHKHFFKETEEGVEMTDIVHYALPFGALGRFAHWLFVRNQLHGIFRYRYEKLEKMFNNKSVHSERISTDEIALQQK